MLLADKRIILTGCASGIGAAAARAFVAEGAHVACFDVAPSGHEVVEQATRGGAGRASFARCDVSVRTEVVRAVDDAVATLGGLDALLHVAGVFAQAPADAIGEDDWARMLAVNLSGTVHVNQAVFAHLR